mmetsp:Transcript_25129/g.64219  ORF Transcript_25129/g.64219 Transcript_25129/m.64219 type:complete len:451 (-) Transcript_25129:46-1398(-)
MSRDAIHKVKLKQSTNDSGVQGLHTLQEQVVQRICSIKRKGLWLRPGHGVTWKFDRLLELLDEISDRECHSIIFVERTAAAYLLLQLLKDAQSDLQLRAVTGKTSPTEKQQALDSLAGSGPCFLVATAALEEGIDVPEVNSVIRFDRFELVRQHIQGAGRARADDARIFYFENDPKLMVRMAEEMKRLALGDAVSRSEVLPDLNSRQDPATGAVLNLFTAPDILRACERCGLVLIFKAHQLSCVFPGKSEPDIVVHLSQFDHIFGRESDIVADDVRALDPDRTREWSDTEVQGRKLKLLMAHELYKRGFINGHLLPTNRIPASCQGVGEDVDPLRSIPSIASVGTILKHKTQLNEWLMRALRRPLKDGVDFCYSTTQRSQGWKAVLAVVVWDWFGIFESQVEFSRKAAAEDDAAKIAFQSCSELAFHPWTPDVAIGITAKEALTLPDGRA